MRIRTRRSDSIGIEIAPLIDIVFILLIFFVVTSTFIRENALEIDLPESHSTVDIGTNGGIEISISSDNQIQVGERTIANVTVDVLKAELAARAIEFGSDRVIVRADAKAHHATVVLALDAANLLGISEVSIVTIQRND